MRLRFVQFRRGKSVVHWICLLAVAMTSILHVDASFATTMPPDGIVFSMPQEDDQGSDDQVVSERCHLCSVTAIASLVTSVAVAPACPIVPSSRARSLIAFKLPTTAPPPKA
jgi:hypothetical protein